MPLQKQKQTNKQKGQLGLNASTLDANVVQNDWHLAR